MPNLGAPAADFQRLDGPEDGRSERLRQRVVELVAEGLPLPRGRTFELLRLLSEPVLDLRQVTTVIRRDPLLVTQVCAFANSFAPAERSASFPEMVVLLGSERLRLLVWGCALAEFARHRLPAATVRGFWQHSILTGMLAEKMARQSAPEAAERAYLAGLLHDAGRLPLLIALREQQGLGVSLPSHGHDEPSFERRFFGVDHGEVGRWIALCGNLASWMRDVLEYHHEPRLAIEDPALVSIVAAADRYSQSYSSPSLSDSRPATPHQRLAWNQLLDSRRPADLPEQHRAAQSHFLRGSLPDAAPTLFGCC